MVGLDNPLHIAMVLVVVLLVFGAKRLPEMGRSLGEGLRGFKDSVSGEVKSDPEPQRPQLVAAVPAPAQPSTADAAQIEAQAPAEREPIGPAA
jgi:sec-independent protein translocase protein TatA